MNETLEIINKASTASDRWLFVALLVIGMLTIGILAKWFFRQLDKRDLVIAKLQTELGHVRGEFTSFLIGTHADLTKHLAQNSEVIKANTEIHQKTVAMLERIARRHPNNPEL